MKVALVASSYLPRPGALARHVEELARGLSRRGVDVEVLAQDRALPFPPVSEFDGFVVRRFVTSVGHAHFAVAPGLWEHLRRTAPSVDVVHAHTAHLPVALASARAHPGQFILTPHVSVERLLRWGSLRMTRAVIGRAAQTVCSAATEARLLRARFPWAADRISVVPPGVDVAAVRAARSFDHPGAVVVSAAPLERHQHIGRAIAALPALGPAFRLGIVGDGPARQRLLAHASDLRVSQRVEFVGSVPDAERYRWLRTARVAVALAEHDTSGIHVVEALAAGVPMVASDIPVHREAAEYADGAAVRFVSPTTSPLEIADLLYEAAESPVPRTGRSRLPTWDDAVESTLALYMSVTRGRIPPAVVGG